MKKYLNVGFSGSDLKLINNLKKLGFDGIRSGIKSEQDFYILDMAKDSGMNWIFLLPFEKEFYEIEDVTDLAFDVSEYMQIRGMDTSLYAIEIINEPTALNDHWKNDVTRLAEAFIAAINTIRANLVHVNILSPSIHDTDVVSIEYLDKFLDLTYEYDYDLAFHRYPNYKDFNAPKNGFINREAELVELKAIARYRKLWLTETGLSQYQSKSRNFPLCFLKENVTLSQEKQVEAAKFEMNFWNDIVKGFVWYQINDGPDSNNKEHGFGIRDINNNWKEVAYVWKG